MNITGYTLTVTTAQAETLILATEILARLGIGQFRDALERLPTREFMPDGWHEDMDSIGKILSRHMIGGPAKMFDAIADRIRAGDSMKSCMADYEMKFKRPNG